jgi:hypothetical protein
MENPLAFQERDVESGQGIQRIVEFAIAVALQARQSQEMIKLLRETVNDQQWQI